MDTNVLTQICSVENCSDRFVSSLGQENFCLNHFLQRCYHHLEGLDPRGRRFCSEPLDAASMRAFIEECSRKALDVSLHSQDLNNLDRGRLLDILLWAGELFVLLRTSRFTLGQSIALGDGAVIAGVAAARS